MNQDITVCITSCGRWDLLEQTIKSLIQNWDGPVPKAVLIKEDTPLDQTIYDSFVNGCEHLLKGFAPVEVWHGKHGQIKSVDHLYSLVNTGFIFHCEDDWQFFKPDFIKPSLDILESDPKVMQVWIRQPNDRNGHPAFGGIRKTGNGTNYQYMSHNFAGGRWRGFSFNPGLRRLSDYQAIGGSYSAIVGNSKGLEAESRIGQAYYKNGFRAATLLTGYVKHIGNGRHINE